MICLRELCERDAKYMLEWMHDTDIQKNFQKKLDNMTLEDAKNFCNTSKIHDVLKDGDSLHFAIVDNDDEYLGTISLKKISLVNKSAEYAISTRKKAHGMGIAKKATGLLLSKAFEVYGLHKVYLNVLKYNLPAIRLYERCGFVHEGTARESIFINGKFETLEWYGIINTEFDKSLFE